jgi:hypothetical protein
LLRGERAETYLAGGERREVCELCKSRALHEGWVREGTVPAYDSSIGGSDRRRSLLHRLRSRGDGRAGVNPRPTLADELDGQAWADSGAAKRDGAAVRSRSREPRHVRAVPTSAEHKQAQAVELFNASEHPRTIAGVARSLGGPTVSVRPSSIRPSLVGVSVSWELCWYRYEVDLADDQLHVRLAAQGYELDELGAEERQPNAVADEGGTLSLA